jgi:hypothetical protein
MQHLKTSFKAAPMFQGVADITLEKIVFYADHPNYQNRIFSFKVTTNLDAALLLLRFRLNGNFIRSAFLKGFTASYDGLITPYQYRVNNKYLIVLNSKSVNDFSLFI